eukprot:Rmarinus@m.16448
MRGMRKSLLLLVAIAAFSVVSAKDDVIVLNSENFDHYVHSGDILVEFFAPWCGHCKKLAPVYEEAAGKLRGMLSFATVDATENKALAEDHGVSGYPSIKWYRDGHWRDYKSGRKVEDFIEFAKRINEEPVKHFLTEQDLREAMERFPVLYVAAADDGIGAAEKKTLRAIARRYQDSLGFADCLTGGCEDLVSSKLGDAAADASGPGLYVLKDGTGVKYSGTGLSDFDATVEWVEETKRELVPEITRHNFRDVANKRPVCVCVVDPALQRRETARYIEEMRLLAQEENQREDLEFSFGYLDFNEWDEHLMDKFSITHDDVPLYFVLDGEWNVFYLPPADAPTHPTLEDRKTFLRMVSDNEIPAQGAGSSSFAFMFRTILRDLDRWLQVNVASHIGYIPAVVLAAVVACLPFTMLMFLILGPSSPVAHKKDE